MAFARTSSIALLGALMTAATVTGPALAQDADCPNDGAVRFGVEPYEASAKLIPVYNDLAALLGKKLGCKVEVLITTNYTAEIEAMRNDKLELAQFGPLGYVLAHQIADAQAFATFSKKDGTPDTYTAGIVTWPGSGITKLEGVKGHAFAFSDPASTSGHLFPAYALRKAGVDPDHDVKPVYAGSHTATFEALRNHKVDAGEMNSEQIEAATNAGVYDPKSFVELWRSGPIPTDPITVRGDLPDAMKSRLKEAVLGLDLNQLPQEDRKTLIGAGDKFVPIEDQAFDGIRDLVHTLNIDLAKL